MSTTKVKTPDSTNGKTVSVEALELTVPLRDDLTVRELIALEQLHAAGYTPTEYDLRTLAIFSETRTKTPLDLEALNDMALDYDEVAAAAEELRAPFNLGLLRRGRKAAVREAQQLPPAQIRKLIQMAKEELASLETTLKEVESTGATSKP